MFVYAKPGQAVATGSPTADTMVGSTGTLLDAGAGNDMLVGTIGTAYDGGAGNDTLLLTGAGALMYGRGDGIDQVWGQISGSTLFFGDALGPREISLQRLNGDLILHAGGIGGGAPDATTVVLHGAANLQHTTAITPEGGVMFYFSEASPIA